jgi:hypothetical protein
LLKKSLKVDHIEPREAVTGRCKHHWSVRTLNFAYAALSGITKLRKQEIRGVGASDPDSDWMRNFGDAQYSALQ